MNKITFNSLGLKIPNPQKKQDTAIVYCKRFSNEDSIAQQLREAIRYCRTRGLRIEKFFVDYRIDSYKAFGESYKYIQMRRINNFVFGFSKNGISQEGIELIEKVIKGKYKIDITIL